MDSTIHRRSVASYADVLHRLSLGEEILGSELLALPGLIPDPIILEPMDYGIFWIPEVITQAAAWAAKTPRTHCDEDFVAAAELINREIANCFPPVGEPLPKEFRGALWNIGIAADIATRIEGL